MNNMATDETRPWEQPIIEIALKLGEKQLQKFTHVQSGMFMFWISATRSPFSINGKEAQQPRLFQFPQFRTQTARAGCLVTYPKVDGLAESHATFRV
jgi:hypothetical protein